MPLLGRELELFPQHGLELPVADCPWWVAHTKSRQEKALARHLAPLGIPFYLPQLERRVRRSGRTFVSYLPLFPGYLFLRGRDAERLAALRSDLVMRILEVGDQTLLDRELIRLRRLQLTGASLVPVDDLVVGEEVRIVEGPLKGLEGVVLRGTSGFRFVVSVSMLRQSVAVEFDREALAPLRPRHHELRDERSAVA